MIFILLNLVQLFFATWFNYVLLVRREHETETFGPALGIRLWEIHLTEYKKMTKEHRGPTLSVRLTDVFFMVELTVLKNI